MKIQAKNGKHHLYFLANLLPFFVSLTRFQYRKRPLDSDMEPRSRRRRVDDFRASLVARSEEEGVPPLVLLGCLLFLENRSGGDQALSDIGWKIFKGGSWKANPSASLEEAIWMVERSGMSQAVYLDLRLRFKDKFSFPPLMQIRAENHRHRPALTVKRHGVKAPLMQCLSLTLTERLQHMYLSGVMVGFKSPSRLSGA